MKLACALVLVLIAWMPLATAGAQSVQEPAPGVSEPADAAPGPSEPADPLVAAYAHVAAGRWEEAVAAFETAARGRSPLPAAALAQWGIALSEAGRPLAAYIRLRQGLLGDGDTADRDNLTVRVARARDAVLAAAARFSRVFASVEQRPDGDAQGERRLARVAARDGDVSLEALIGPRIESPVWRRADEIRLAPYTDLVRQLLDAPALTVEFPAQTFDANAPGPRRAAIVRLVVGDEEWRAEALGGEPYARVTEMADAVLEFARSVPALPKEDRKTPPASPSRSGKKRR